MFTELVWFCAMGLLHRQLSLGAVCKGEMQYLTATEEPQSIHSPNYPYDYFNNELCRWIVTAERSWQVVQFRVLESSLQTSVICGEDYVEVKDGRQNWSPTIKRWCGEGPPLVGDMSSTGRDIFVAFRTDGKNRGKGFKMEFWTAPRGETKYREAHLGTAHYLLYITFGFIASSIFIGFVAMGVFRRLCFRARVSTKFSSHLSLRGSSLSLDLHRRRRSSPATVSTTTASPTTSRTTTGIPTPTPRTTCTPV